MNHFSFSRGSLQSLSTTTTATANTCYRALAYGVMDFSVVCGYRPEDEQNAAFDANLSRVKFPDSPHNKKPSHAVDVYPWHPRFGSLTGSDEQVEVIALEMAWSYERTRGFIWGEYHRLAGLMFAAAIEEGERLRWGGDWDGDGDILDQTFMDLCHFEVIG